MPSNVTSLSRALQKTSIALALALPAFTASDALAQPAPQEASVRPGWLGVALDRNQPAVPGAHIARPIPDAPAAAAGITRGDVIIAVNGEGVATAAELIDAVSTIPAGSAVSLTLGGANPRTVDIVLIERPDDVSSLGRRLIGAPLPAMQATSVTSGQSEAVAPDDGRVRLIEMWATWCGPCRTAAPTLAAFVEETPSESFELVTVSSEDRATVASYGERNPLPGRSLVDPSETVEGDLWITSTPTYVLLNRSGEVIAYETGLAGLRRALEQARTLLMAD